MEDLPGAKVSANTFKILESLRDPEDFRQLTAEMLDKRYPPTVQRLRSLHNAIQRSRWWTWILQHPALGPELIHPTKSVPFSS